MVYRKVADEKKPKIFSSGVVKEYVMDSVVVLAEAKVAVKVDAQGKRYVVEAAIPLAALGLKLTDGLALRGDFGATHGDKSGKDTVLRTHWNNQPPASSTTRSSNSGWNRRTGANWSSETDQTRRVGVVGHVFGPSDPSRRPVPRRPSDPVGPGIDERPRVPSAAGVESFG